MLTQRGSRSLDWLPRKPQKLLAFCVTMLLCADDALLSLMLPTSDASEFDNANDGFDLGYNRPGLVSQGLLC